MVLLADDNDEDINLALWAFGKRVPHTKIVVARDGAEALNLLLPTDRQTPLHPQIVLLDLNIPGISGLEVLKHLRADPFTVDQPVITLTHARVDGEAIASYDVGAHSWVQKPVKARIPELATVLYDYWLGVNRLADRLEALRRTAGAATLSGL
jgi:two-component system, response regulator